jgi:pyruvate dehydrogenase E2 component (dihydrolipoamide acetyltransferase)
MTDLDDASNITQAPPVPTHAEERRPLTRMRRTIADNLTKRWQEVPHVTGHSDADASPLIELRNELSRAWDEKVPVDALMIALSTIALRDFPTFRARVDGNEVVVANRYDIGVAVDTDDGLIVPVLRAVDAMSVREVAAQLRTVAAKARARELGPNDLVGNVFTVSNLGPVGIGHATSITPEGTTALLSVGRSVASWTTGPDGSPNPTQRLPLSITVDHRAIDGADAGRFLSRVIDLIEHPVAALMA